MTNAARQQQSHQRQKTAFMVVLVAIIVGVGVYLYQMPWGSKELDIGFSEEARRKPYMAAEQFLNRFDLEVTTETGLALLDNLPSTDDTLLIGSSRRSLSERRVKSLTDWVAGGGALILLANDFYDADRDDKGDRFLNNFGIWLYDGEPSEPVETPSEPDQETNQDNPAEAAPKTFADILLEAQAPKDNCKRTYDGLTGITLEGEQQELFADLSSERHLYFDDDKDYEYASNSTGAQLVYIEHGQGRLYVLTSLNPWKNKNIGCLDHAHLLRKLTENTQALWLLFNTDIEPIHQLIWNQWPIAVCLAFAWLALWIWRSAFRTVRIESDEPRARRELMEHISGLSRFLYQQNELNLLLSGLRADCLPHDPMPAPETIARWSKSLDIDEQQIHWALTANISRDSKELISAVTVLQKIRDLPTRRSDEL